MLSLDAIAERRILEAQARGEFDDLPGTGAPLALDDDALVPQDLRAAYRVLKNARFLPPEMESSSEVREVEQLLRQVEDETERARLLSRIGFLLGRARARMRQGDLRVENAYLEKVAAHLAARRENR